MLKKADRVKTVEEAEELQSLGVDFIGISLHSNLWFTDDRCVGKEEAIKIRKVLFRSKLIGEVVVEDDFNKTLSLIDGIGLDYVQTNFSTPFSAECRNELKNRGVGIIYAGIDASHDDDPAWILGDYIDNSELGISFFQIDIFGDMKYAWIYLSERTPEFPDDIQISEIEEIGSKVPIIITLDFSVDNVLEILNRMSTAKGICMTIAEGTTRNDIHYFDYAAVVEMAKKLTN
jgi:hypothetical protein